MSKITPPPAMTAEQLKEIHQTWKASVPLWFGVATGVAAARDKQWLDMLAQQKPVAYRYDLARYWPSDVRGRQWMFGVYSEFKPELNEMVQNVTPLYAAPVAQQADPLEKLTREQERLGLYEAPAPQPPRSALIAMKTLLSRDPCVHANTAIAMIDEVLAAPAPQPLTCEWSFEDDDSGTWRSSCGELWCFIDGGPKENRVTYCHHCGGKVGITKGDAS